MQVEQWFGTFKLQIIFQRYQRAQGICSQLEDGMHFLMWDFDGVELDDVIIALRNVQVHWRLPVIHVIQSNKEGSFHAYCFSRNTWSITQSIIAQTEQVDGGYHKIAVLRGYYTLRITPKVRQDGTLEGFKSVGRLQGFCEQTVDPQEAMRMVKYWTKRK